MDIYLDINDDSGVQAYEIGVNYIHVQFKDERTYEYTPVSAGQENLNTMKSLARNGDGLNSFINKNVKNAYSRKW